MIENNHQPAISVFTSCKNSGKFLRETLDSIFNQTFTDYEVVLVDGASTDDTIKILESYDYEKRLIWITEPDNSASEGFHKALSLTRGKYIMCLPVSDGYLNNNWFQRCVDIMENDMEVSLVWGFPQTMSENGELGKISYCELFDTPPPQKLDFFTYWLVTGLMFCEMNYCVRTDIYKNCFPKFNTNDLLERYNPFLKFVYNFNVQGYLSYFIPVVACFGRTHNDSRNISMEEINNKLTKQYLNLIREYKEDILKGKTEHFFRDGSSEIIRSIEKSELPDLRKNINRHLFFSSEKLFFWGSYDKSNFYILLKKHERFLRKLYWKMLRVRNKV